MKLIKTEFAPDGSQICSFIGTSDDDKPISAETDKINSDNTNEAEITTENDISFFEAEIDGSINLKKYSMYYEIWNDEDDEPENAEIQSACVNEVVVTNSFGSMPVSIWGNPALIKAYFDAQSTTQYSKELTDNGMHFAFATINNELLSSSVFVDPAFAESIEEKTVWYQFLYPSLQFDTGSTFIEVNSGKVYFYFKEDSEWIEYGGN